MIIDAHAHLDLHEILSPGEKTVLIPKIDNPLSELFTYSLQLT
jgi:hypothetical protein